MILRGDRSRGGAYGRKHDLYRDLLSEQSIVRLKSDSARA